MEITKVKKRDNAVVEFDRTRIEKAVEKACSATGVAVGSHFYTAVTDDITHQLDDKFFERIPGVEDIEKAVEMTLADRGLFEAARAYTLSRNDQAKIHEGGVLLESAKHR